MIKHTFRLFFLLIFLLLSTPILLAQSASAETIAHYESIRLGILIQGQGLGLYRWFGHAAIVLSGPPQALRSVAQENREHFIHSTQYNGEELLFDYGNFDSGGSDFVFRFLVGKLDYYKSYKYFHRYIERNAIYEKRGIDIYWLNLDYESKRKFISILFLETNPANRVYKYDFYFDNCVTRIRDQLDRVFDGGLRPQIIGQSEYSIRQILRREIGDKFWGLLLLESLQGPQIDQKYSRWDSVFFPSYMPVLLEQLKIPGSNKLLVASRENIFPFQREELERLHTDRFFRRNFKFLLVYFIVSLVGIRLYHLYRRQRYKNEIKFLRIVNFFHPTMQIMRERDIRSKYGIGERLFYYVMMISLSIVLVLLTTTLWLFHIMQSYDASWANILLFLGSPFLLLQIILGSLMIIRALRPRLALIMLWNWRIHFGLVLVLPVYAWFYSWAVGQYMQNVFLPWLAVFPIMLAVECFLSHTFHCKNKEI